MRGSALLLLAPLLSACVLTTHTDFPAGGVDGTSIMPKEVPLHYRVEPVSYWRDALYTAKADFFADYPSRREDYDALRQAFEQNTPFSSTIPRLTPPEKGLYCVVEVEYRPVREGEAFLLALAHASAAILPSYHSRSQHIVRYHLYVNQKLAHTYEYSIRTVQAAWLGLIPFWWAAALTPDLGDAFRATTHQFFMDAAMDGYLRPA